MHATRYHTNKSQNNFVREAKKIVETAKKPEKQRQCLVCGSFIGKLDVCCDETEYSNRIQPDQDDPRTLVEPF